MVVQISQGPVEFELLLRQEGEFGKICAALRLGNQGSQVAEAGGDGTLLNFLDCALDFALFGWLDFGQESLGQQGPLTFVFDDVHGIGGLSSSQGLHGCKCAKRLKP